MKNSDSPQKDPVLKKAKQDSSFRALKKLVEAENNVRVAHNRIRALQINDDINRYKAHNQLGLISKIQQIRQVSNQHNCNLSAKKQQLQEQTESNRQKFLELGSKRKHKIKTILDDLKHEKKNQYLMMEEQSQHADRQISENKNNDTKQKSLHRKRIADQEQQAKQSRVKFLETKQAFIKTAKDTEIQEIKAKEALRIRQLKDLSNIQVQFLQKQSQSQAAYQQIKDKLDLMLNTVKQQLIRSKKTLKSSFHMQTQQNEIQ